MRAAGAARARTDVFEIILAGARRAWCSVLPVRSFVVKYRVGRRSRRKHLKAGLTPTDARREAKKMRGDGARGLDPVGAERKAGRIIAARR